MMDDGMDGWFTPKGAQGSTNKPERYRNPSNGRNIFYTKTTTSTRNRRFLMFKAIFR